MAPVRSAYDWREHIAPYFPAELARALMGLDAQLVEAAVELRVRLARPLILVSATGDVLVDRFGRPVNRPADALCPGRAQLDALVDSLTGGSFYAVEEQIRQGYLTLPGGHRVGFCGQVVLGPGGSVRTLGEVSSVTVRLSRAVIGAARPALPHLVVSDGGQPRLASVLVLSPPGAGKTTFLRDLARLASWGAPELGLPPRQVVIVDERSEIAGCYQGIPQHDVGPRTDVLDRCPKAEGILWAVRALNPGVLVTDEIGAAADVEALLYAGRTGAALAASAHAPDLAWARRRDGLRELLARGVFERAVTLSTRRGPGTVERVDDAGAGG